MDIYQNNCRICLEKPAVLDWNEEIPDFCNVTYKYCYIMYTQLEDDQVSDIFSQMLCESCASELKKAHFLIQRAIESYKTLQKIFRNNIIKVEEDTRDDEQVADSTDFEIEIFKHSTKSLIEIQNGNLEMEMSKNSIEEQVSTKLKEEEIHGDNDTNNFPKEVEKQSIQNLNNLSTQDKTNVSTTEAKSKKSHIMCPYCSKLIIADNIKLHEEIHQAVRERTEICQICGLKLFNKRTLNSHMLTHKKNREKKYKCEFCEKAYFNRGALTLHRRLHLGQMIPCPICPKEFYRQIDLDRHNLSTHSASFLAKDLNRTKYYFECKECNKSIPSHKWKSHRDTHLKKFQMKCTLCDKHFATKSCCHKHVYQVHKKTKEEYAKFVLYYGDNVDARTSHLMIQQREKLRSVLK